MVLNIARDEVEIEPKELPKLVAPQADSHQFQVSYATVLLFAYWHVAGLYGLYLCCTSARWQTVFYTAVLTELSTIGTFCGAHRLWCHKGYKAKLPLEWILLTLQTLGGQNSVFHWVRDHRMHHRYSDTDADPHNATRGFFFSHLAHAVTHRHPEVKRRGKKIDMSDILNNPLLAFQRKYAFPIFIFIGYLIPTAIPMYFWNEGFNNAYHANILRFILSLHFTCMINSAAHIFGNRPYDKKVMATENISVMLVTFGEGSHNYHHVFPWDYRAAELGSWLNFSKTFIDFFALIGWAYDLRTISPKTVVDRVKKTGDGTYLEM